MELLKPNSLSLKVCSPKHDWLFIPPSDKRVPGKLLVDGEYVSMEETIKEEVGVVMDRRMIVVCCSDVIFKC